MVVLIVAVNKYANWGLFVFRGLSIPVIIVIIIMNVIPDVAINKTTNVVNTKHVTQSVILTWTVKHLPKIIGMDKMKQNYLAAAMVIVPIYEVC